MTMSYEEWRKTRLERVPGRCGGRPTLIGTRLQPHDIGRCAWEDVWWNETTREDWENCQRFMKEEPHWQALSTGLDRDGRELTEEEYRQLEKKYPRIDNGLEDSAYLRLLAAAVKVLNTYDDTDQRPRPVPESERTGLDDAFEKLRETIHGPRVKPSVSP